MKSAFLRSLAAALMGLAAVTAAAQGSGLKGPIASRPAFLTSVGQQGADVEAVKVLMDRAGIPYKADAKARASALAPSGAKTLVLAIGGSAKALGSAGLSAEEELERTRAVVAEARKRGMKVIGLHVGGEARRGELPDRFVTVAAPLCDYVIVVADGNKDGLFNKLCAKSGLDVVDKLSRAGDPLAKAFLQ